MEAWTPPPACASQTPLSRTYFLLKRGGSGVSSGGTGGGGGPNSAALPNCCSSLATKGCSNGLPCCDRGVRRLDTPQHNVPCNSSNARVGMGVGVMDCM